MSLIAETAGGAIRLVHGAIAVAGEAADEPTTIAGASPTRDAIGTVGEVLMVLGAVTALIAAIGVNRFGDIYKRMHAAAKTPTLGLILVAIGAMLRLRTGVAIGTLALVVVLQLITSPVSTNVVARAIHLRIAVPLDGRDDLARDEATARPGIDDVV